MKQIVAFILLSTLPVLMGEGVFAQNQQGGGVYVDGAQVTSSVISGNQAMGEGTGIYATGNSALVNNTVADNRQGKQFSQAVGDVYGGGIVFFIDQNARKALIVSLTEVPVAAKNFYKTWGEMGQNIAAASDVNNGKQNTNAIIAAQVITPDIDATRDNPPAGGRQNFKLPADTARRAAHWCTEFKDDGLKDWFLPSREQLKKLYVAKSAMNTILSATSGATILGNGYYWSSTQADANEAWYVYFDNGETNVSAKSNTANVRAIREINF